MAGYLYCSRRQAAIARHVALVILACSLFQLTEGQTIARDKDALLAIRAAFGDPALLSSWDATKDPCTPLGGWLGITNCSTAAPQVVYEVRLPFLGLNGTIAPETGDLLNLIVLDLSGNNLQGPIPTQLAKIARLTTLDLTSNRLSGTIPQALGNLGYLYELKLTNNRLSGSLPASLSNCTSLYWLAVEDNSLSGPLPPELAKLKALMHMHFDHNFFSGTLPGAYSYLPRLLHIIVSSNNLTGPIPPELGISQSIRVLRFDDNHFTGTIPGSLGNMSSLTQLILSSNNLTGSIPPQLGNAASLLDLELDNNQLTGPIPEALGNLTYLTSMNVENNQLSGLLPTSLGNLQQLETFIADNNLFTGSLPASYLSNPSLVALHLFNNQLVGPLPSGFKNGEIDARLYNNPWCLSPQNAAQAACLVDTPPASAPAPGAAPPTVSTATAGGCGNCQPNQVVRAPLVQGDSCACVWPLVVTLALEQVAWNQFNDSLAERLASNLARELFLQPSQVRPSGRNANGTIANAVNDIIPISGSVLDFETQQRVTNRLGNRIALLDGILGAQNYSAVSLVQTMPGGGSSSLLSTSSSSSSNTGAIVGGVVGGVLGTLAVLALIGGAIWYHRRQKKRSHEMLPLWKRGEDGRSISVTFSETGKWLPAGAATTSSGTRRSYPPAPPRSSASHSSTGPVKRQLTQNVIQLFTREELATATGNFAPERQLGVGGFGTVYRGTLENGQEVAVKMLDKASQQGEAEFRAELTVIGHELIHPNLVRLIGYCAQGQDRLLVYELMSGGSLKDYLGGESSSVLDWRQRLQIAWEAAAGLQFLHEGVEPPVVHRDIKASNILLDQNLHAKIADFGLAKLFPNVDDTHLSTRVVGTFGYLAPDYSMTGQLTVKSDVYSFGVVLLELMTGLKAIDLKRETDTQHLVPWINQTLQKSGDVKNVMDPKLKFFEPEMAARIVDIALGCVEYSPDNRPSMGQVLVVLEAAYAREGYSFSSEGDISQTMLLPR